MKTSAILVVFITLILITVYNPSVKPINEKRILENKEKIENCKSAKVTEYWALIVGVGLYYKHPEQNRPEMLETVDYLQNELLESNNWKPDNIHTLKGSKATGINLIAQLFWLIRNSNEDDMVLIFITTHGSPMNYKGHPIDLPPVDEADHADEILVMYHGFDRSFSFISDDCLNFFLSLLKAKGVCVIIDSCYSGGFNDAPFFKTKILENDISFQDYNAESFKQGFIEDIASQDRVVLMSTEEDSVSYSNIFSAFLIYGLWYNLADMNGNQDGINSAEEAFYFSDKMLSEQGPPGQNPTILDLYPGEFTLTYV